MYIAQLWGSSFRHWKLSCYTVLTIFIKQTSCWLFDDRAWRLPAFFRIFRHNGVATRSRIILVSPVPKSRERQTWQFNSRKVRRSPNQTSKRKDIFGVELVTNCSGSEKAGTKIPLVEATDTPKPLP